MNQEIVNQFTRKISLLYDAYKNEEIDMTNYVYDKMMLFKEYMLYEEEVREVFLISHRCYLAYFEEREQMHCSRLSCLYCSKYTVYDILLRSMNHYL